jgi:ESS family glutamate:Na+ symporter
MDLSARQTVLIGILAYFLGKYLTRKFVLLRDYNIPEPVTGGLLVSLLISLLYFTTGYEIAFTLTTRDNLLLVFFTCIGLTSRFEVLRQGGRSLVVLLGLAVGYLVVQNLVGISIASALDLDTRVGLIGGSVSLSGGHGTAIAWSSTFRELGIENALEIGIASATFGLVLGGVVGGPVAHYLIKRHGLQSRGDEDLTVGFKYDAPHQKIDVDTMLIVIFVIALAIGIGTHLNELLVLVGLDLPDFVTCLFAGILITNLVPLLFPKFPCRPEHNPTLSLVSDLSLGLFLAMSLMSMQLWTILGLAGPIGLILAAQLVTILLYTVFVVFRLMGRDYDAAVMSSGYVGLALGATPTAIANMSAVTKKFGAAPRAFIVVPLVGAFFIDISNAVIINRFIEWLE